MSLVDYYLNGRKNDYRIETLQISHSAFSQVYYLCRNKAPGITATLEDATTKFFQYCPMSIKRAATRDNLDRALSIEIGDVGTILPDELDRIQAADAAEEKPIVTYRSYRSNDLTTILEGPIKLEVTDLGRNWQGASFEAHAPYLNLAKTGIRFDLTTFPGLRGYL